jgi:hypothetical protein
MDKGGTREGQRRDRGTNKGHLQERHRLWHCTRMATEENSLQIWE